MKNNNIYILGALLVISVVLIFADIFGTFSDKKNVVELLNQGIEHTRLTNIEVDSMEDCEIGMDSALYYFDKAYQLLPHHNYTRYCNALACYCLSKYGEADSILSSDWISAECSFLQSLIAIHSNDTSRLIDIVAKFIVNKPDAIESQFVYNIKKIDSTIVEKALQVSKKQLAEEWQSTNNPIVGAWFAKVLLSLGDKQAAKHIFEQIIGIMPNMNRPWFYLACMAFNERDTLKAYSYLETSRALDVNDPLLDVLDSVISGNRYSKKMRWVYSSHVNLMQAYNVGMPNSAIIIKGLNEYLHPCDTLILKNYIN